MISYDPRITIQRDRRVRSGGRVAYGKPINFAGMKKICMFVASYIQSGRVFCLFVAGIFYALTLHIHGFVPPCGALMRPLPLWCRTTGKAEPFFISARQTFSVMSNTREKCLNGKITPRSNRPAHDTSESIYSKFLIEKQACVTAFRNYIGVPALSGFSDLDTTPNPTGYIPMLATGVKDENGQMVFERDVVVFDAEKYTDGEVRGLLLCDVKYDPEFGGFCLYPIEGEGDMFPMWKISESIRIVGNKYEGYDSCNTWN